MSWKEKIIKFRETKEATQEEINKFVEEILNGKAYDRGFGDTKDERGVRFTNEFRLSDLQKIADRLSERVKWLESYYARDNDGGLE